MGGLGEFLEKKREEKEELKFLNKIESLGNSSNSSVEEGNSSSAKTSSKKQISPSVRWVMVLNNWTEEELKSISSICSKKCKYAIIEKEVGEEGTPHLQGYFELKKKDRPCSVFNNPRIWFEKAKGKREHNNIYCSKDENIVVSIGRPKPIKIIQTLYPWQKEIEDLILTEPDDRKIYWFYEKKGGIGKSQFIKYCIVKHKVLFCSGGKHSDIINLVFNQDMDETNCVIFDIPRANEGFVSYSALESIKNGMVCNTKYETGVKIFNSPHIICFANFPPENPEKLSEDRWVITNLRESELDSDDELITNN